MLKVTISYDMREGKEQDCQEFLVNKLAPGLAQMGFRLSDVWYTVWGTAPQITGGGEVENLDHARRIFLSNDWQDIATNMGELTDNFAVRILSSRN